MIVVLDTNIWKSSLYLKAGAAAAMRFYLHQKGAKVGMPEVIRLEVEHHLRADLAELRDRIRGDHARLLGMVGNLREAVLPDDSRIDEVVESFIRDLKFNMVEVGLTIEAARASFLRTINKVAPSHNSQQFKDGVIWSNCLELAKTDDVTLVTSDKAFFADGDTKKGLAPELLAETLGLSHSLRVVNSLGALMSDIKAPINVDDAALVSAVEQQLASDIDGATARRGFVRTGTFSVTRSFYATETPYLLFVEFRVVFDCDDASSEGRTDAKLTVTGDGQFNAEAKEFIGLSPTGVEMNFVSSEGVAERSRGVYLRAEGIVIGSRTVHHVVREPLDEEQTISGDS